MKTTKTIVLVSALVLSTSAMATSETTTLNQVELTFGSELGNSPTTNIDNGPGSAFRWFKPDAGIDFSDDVQDIIDKL